jgi:hypothetical protein
MKNHVRLITFIFCCLFCASTVSAQCEGYAYIYSQTSQTSNSVHGYTTTYLDYCAGLYYDPEVLGSFAETLPGGPAIIGEGFSQGYNDTRPAELQFDYRAPLKSAPYTVGGNHFLTAYYQVWVEVWTPGYYWYDPFQFGFAGIGDGYEIYSAPDYYGYFTYVSYWISMREYIGATSDTLIYQGQTQCLPGQQFTSTGQPCSSLPECQSGEQFTSTGELCPNYVPPPEPPMQPTVSVQVDIIPLRPQGTIGGTNTSPVATCITGVPNPAGLPVQLQLSRDTALQDYDGGHRDAYHTGPRPLGKLASSQGVTGPDGCFRTRYYPPHISGVFRLKSTISGISNDTQLGAWVRYLEELKPGLNYNLIGADSAHPENHWGTREARDGLVKIANDYAAEFYGGTPPNAEKIAYNDMSLFLGGKFDLYKRWENLSKDHAEHRDGINCDVRSLNVDRTRWLRLKQIFRTHGSTRTKDETGTSRPHWHLRFEFNYATVENTNSQMQNGIEQNYRAFVEYNDVQRTAASFVTDAGSAIFDRELTQAEFEAWYPQLSNAKTQGLNTFLQEVKTFERQLFTSQEYIARQRTDEQFVEDIFASHLFRQPTPEERSYWLEYLLTIGGSQETIINPTEPTRERAGTGTIQLNQQQKRLMFLNNFQNLPDFVNLVGGIVDDTDQ